MVVVGCDCDWEEEEVAVEDLLACLVKARQEAAEVQRRHLVRTKRGKLAFLVLVLFHDILGKGGFGVGTYGFPSLSRTTPLGSFVSERSFSSFVGSGGWAWVVGFSGSAIVSVCFFSFVSGW